MLENNPPYLPSHGPTRTRGPASVSRRSPWHDLSTVGFGDITPTTDAARVLVSLQMLLDLVIIALIVRLVLNTAKTSLLRACQNSADSS
jgi:hypothetical protein